jgi:predicted nucleotide-binding protein (sugar kinase/HSP70/actin superfamily)
VKVAFPQMGLLEPMLIDLLARLDVEAKPPPQTSPKTLDLGVKFGPEFACLPLKITIGNFMEALDAGADTLVMAGGKGPCRFGYYCETQRRILIEAGYKDFEFVIVEPPAYKPWEFLGAFKKIAPTKSGRQIWDALKLTFLKGQAVDMIEKRSLELRCLEAERGAVSAAKKRALAAIQPAWTKTEIDSARAEALEIMGSVPLEARDVLKVGIVGEFYMVLEPYVNFDIEEYLGQSGCYLERAVYLSDWMGPSGKNPVMGHSDGEIADLAEDYLSHFVGGEGQATVGHAVMFARAGFDGIVHLMPFTCMPETIAKAIFPRVQREEDIPILSFVIDEQTGKAGVVTRLEAFLDLLQSRHERREIA